MSIYICCGTDKGDIFTVEYNCQMNVFYDKFIDAEAHLGPITALTADENTLISVDSSGIINSYSFESKRKLVGFDNSNEFCITSLSTSNDKKYLFTPVDDGKIIIWEKFSSSWKKIKIIDMHKKSLALSIHPSDKFAISVSKDNTLRVWNLYNGKQCHKMPIMQSFTNVCFSPSGKYYLLQAHNLIKVYEIMGTKQSFIINTLSNIKGSLFINNNVICVAELKKVSFYELSQEGVIEAKSIDMIGYHCKHISFSESQNSKYFICVMSQYNKILINVYDISFDLENKIKLPALLASYKVPNLRITTMICVNK